MEDLDFDAIEQGLRSAEALFAADLDTLNNSGASGIALFAVEGDTLTVTIVGQGLEPDQVHLQHIHGRLDEEGNPIDSEIPGIEADTDRDGFIEVAEGAPLYGDILLPLEDQSDGFNNDPMADENGMLAFSRSFDLTDDSQFLNPLSGTQHAAEDIFPLDFREVVIHGVEIPAEGFGPGTPNEVDGTAGYKLALPAAAGEIVEVDLAGALDRLEDMSGGMIGAEPDSGIVARFYDLLGRPAEAEGLAFWQDQIEMGTSLDAVAEAFIESGEFAMTNGEPDDMGYVELLYSALLDRPADETEVAFWTESLAGGADRADLAVAFAMEAEAMDTMMM